MTNAEILAKFNEATLVLENDRIFYDKFLRLYQEGSDRDATTVRTVIHENLLRLRLVGVSREYRETLRLYFEDRYGLPTKTLNAVKPHPALHEEAPQPTTVKVATQTQVTQPFPEYKAMNAILTLTTKHYINGTDISSLSNSQIYNLIAQQEAAIKYLEAIANKPNSLTKEIADRKAGVQTLVDFLNDRDAKA